MSTVDFRFTCRPYCCKLIFVRLLSVLKLLFNGHNSTAYYLQYTWQVDSLVMFPYISGMTNKSINQIVSSGNKMLTSMYWHAKSPSMTKLCVTIYNRKNGYWGGGQPNGQKRYDSKYRHRNDISIFSIHRSITRRSCLQHSTVLRK